MSARDYKYDNDEDKDDDDNYNVDKDMKMIDEELCDGQGLFSLQLCLVFTHIGGKREIQPLRQLCL